MAKAKEKFRVFVVRKRWWSAAVCLCLAALLFSVVNHPAVIGASAATRQLPIYCVQRDQKLVAISFDAAWGNVILRRSFLPSAGLHQDNTLNSSNRPCSTVTTAIFPGRTSLLTPYWYSQVISASDSGYFAFLMVMPRAVPEIFSREK